MSVFTSQTKETLPLPFPPRVSALLVDRTTWMETVEPAAVHLAALRRAAE